MTHMTHVTNTHRTPENMSSGRATQALVSYGLAVLRLDCLAACAFFLHSSLLHTCCCTTGLGRQGHAEATCASDAEATCASSLRASSLYLLVCGRQKESPQSMWAVRGAKAGLSVIPSTGALDPSSRECVRLVRVCCKRVCCKRVCCKCFVRPCVGLGPKCQLKMRECRRPCLETVC